MLARITTFLLASLLAVAVAAVFWQAWSARQSQMKLDQTIEQIRDERTPPAQIVNPPAETDPDADTGIRAIPAAPVLAVDSPR